MTRENLIQQIKSQLEGSDENWAQIDAYFELSDLEKIDKTMEILISFSNLLILDIFSVLPFSSKPIADYQALYLEKARPHFFHYAILSGNMAAVRLLAERRLPLNPDCFLLVAFTGNMEILHFLESYYCESPDPRYQINLSSISIFIGSKPRTGVNFSKIEDLSCGKSILHFAARSGNEAMFNYILQKVGIHFIAHKDINRETVLGAAVQSRNVELFRHCIQKYNIDPCDIGSLLKHAARGDCVDILRLMIEEHHFYAHTKRFGLTLLDHALSRGSFDVVRYLVENHHMNFWDHVREPEGVIIYRAHSGEAAIIHYCIQHGADLTLIAPVLDHTEFRVDDETKQLLRAALDIERLAFEAIEAGQEATLEQWPFNMRCRNSKGDTLLTAALSTNHMAWIPVLLEKGYPLVDHKGCSLLHAAALVGNVDAIASLMTSHGLDLSAQDNDGRTMLHYLSKSKNNSAFIAFLRRYPHESKAFWIRDNNGDLPSSSLLHQCLREITQAIASGSPVEGGDYALLNEFADEWKRSLLRYDGQLNMQGLMSSIDSFAAYPELQKIITSIRETLVLMSVPTRDERLSYSLFFYLVNSADEIIEKEQSFSHFAMSIFASQQSFLQELKQCLKNIKPTEDDLLNTDVLRTIHVIISDNERRQTSDEKTTEAILQGKLLETASIAGFRPKGSITEGRDIGEHNYAQHLTYMRQRFDNLALLPETRRIGEEILFPGLQHFVENIDAIVKHFIEKPGELYELAESGKLPLHTDHDEGAEAYRKTLHQLLQSIIGAFYLCETAGQLLEFFNRMGSGLCLEIRTRDTMEWAAAFSEVKSIRDFMSDVIHDYTAYSKVMQHKTDESVGSLEPALKFIMDRYKDFPCKIDSTYAPQNKIEEQYIRRYLDEVLAFSADRSLSKILSFRK